MKKFKKKFPKIELKMNMTWKDDISIMLMDWWEGKIVYYKYKGQIKLKLSIFRHF